MKVLITGVGGPAGINTVALLPRDIDAVCCDCDPAAQERAMRAGLRIPVFRKVPRADDKDFPAVIRKIIDEENIDTVIPTVDEELPVFSADQNERVIVSPAGTVKICDDKFLLFEKFRDYSFCPVYSLGGSDLAVYGKVFVKPRTGRGGRGAAPYPSMGEIPGDKLNDRNVICEYLPGDEYTVDAMCDLEGKLLYAVPRVRVEVSNGVSVTGRTENNTQLTDIVHEICKVLKFTGPINLQFKLTGRGKPKIVEINPRFSGGLPITAAAGIDPVRILLDVVQGKAIAPERLQWDEIESANEMIRRLKT